jgi:magnesium chelatase subunit I
LKRESEFIDNKSGVSARMSITAYETKHTAERRALRAGDDKTTLRLSDFMVSYLLLRVK